MAEHNTGFFLEDREHKQKQQADRIHNGNCRSKDGREVGRGTFARLENIVLLKGETNFQAEDFKT